MNYDAIYDAVQEMAADLRGVDLVNTVDIGIEETLNAADYPMIRIVIDEVSPLDEGFVVQNRQANLTIFFGVAVHDFEAEGRAGIYRAQLNMMEQIKAIVEAGHTLYSATMQTTTYDVDSLVEDPRFTAFSIAASNVSMLTHCP